jgi:hypothetical protein
MRADLASKFAKLAPWIFRFRIDGADYGGALNVTKDARVDQFFRFAPTARTILDLGALEGAHTFRLAEHSGVKRVLAIEGRERNLRKARFVQELLGVRNAEFAQANLEKTDVAAFGKFDAVFCSGLIYHLPEPWNLIARLSAVAPRLFIWTHYATDAEAKVVSGGLRGKIYPEGGLEEPLSGLSPNSTWLTLKSLISSLTASGYGNIEVINNDLTHPMGPTVTIGATTAGW